MLLLFFLNRILLVFSTVFIGLALLACDSESRDDSSATPKEPTREVGTKSEARNSVGLEVVRQQIAGNEDWDALAESAKTLYDKELVEMLGELYSGRNSSNRGRGSFVTFIVELAGRDSAAAFAMYKLEEMTTIEAGWTYVAERVAADHPDLLKKWLTEELPKAEASIRLTFMGFGFNAMAASMDPGEVLSFYREADISTKSPREQSKYFVMRIFTAFMNKAPEKAESAAFNLLKGDDLDVALRRIASGTMESDPDKAMALAQKIENHSTKQDTLAMLHRQLLGVDMAEALSRFEKLDAGQIQKIFRDDRSPLDLSAAGMIAKAHPEKLVELMNSMTVSTANQKIFERAVEGLTAAGKGEMALKFIESLPQAGLRLTLFGNYLGKTIAADPEAALKNFSDLPEGKQRDLAYRKIGKFTGRNGGLEAALQTLNEGVPDADKGGFLAAAIPQSIPGSPERVAAFLGSEEAGFLTSEVRQTTYSQVALWYAGKDPGKAVGWLKELPVDDQAWAMKGLSRKLIESDVQGLVSLLSEMPKNEAWAIGVKTLIGDLKNSDPATAQSWQKLLNEREDSK